MAKLQRTHFEIAGSYFLIYVLNQICTNRILTGKVNDLKQEGRHGYHKTVTHDIT
jgi:hypothetical protein